MVAEFSCFTELQCCICWRVAHMYQNWVACQICCSVSTYVQGNWLIPKFPLSPTPQFPCQSFPYLCPPHTTVPLPLYPTQQISHHCTPHTAVPLQLYPSHHSSLTVLPPHYSSNHDHSFLPQCVGQQEGVFPIPLAPHRRGGCRSRTLMCPNMLQWSRR